MSYPKSLRLKSRTAMNRLMQEGKRIKAYPLQLVYLSVDIEPDAEKIQLAFSAPKRLFPLAVDRNRVKRKMRAQLKPHLNTLAEVAPDAQLLCMLIHTGRQAADSEVLADKINLLLSRLHTAINPPKDEQTSEAR